jgi:RNase P subunit RPR2
MHSCEVCGINIPIPPNDPYTHVICIPCAETMVFQYMKDYRILTEDRGRGRVDYRPIKLDGTGPSGIGDAVSKLKQGVRLGLCPQCGKDHRYESQV